MGVLVGERLALGPVFAGAEDAAELATPAAPGCLQLDPLRLGKAAHIVLPVFRAVAVAGDALMVLIDILEACSGRQLLH